MEIEAAARIPLFFVMLVAGCVLVWMGRAAASGRLKRNSLAGIRIPSTMASEEAWLVAHVRAKRHHELAGMTAIVTAFSVFLPVSHLILAAVITIGCLLMLGFVLQGVRVGGRAAKDATNRDESGIEGRE